MSEIDIGSLFEVAKEALDEVDKTAEGSKTGIIERLAEELEGKIRIDSIAEEITFQLKGKVSKTFVYKILDKKYKNKKRVESQKKKKLSPPVDLESPDIVTVSNTGQQTVQEPNPENKLEDQHGSIPDDIKIPEDKYWKPSGEPEDTSQEQDLAEEKEFNEYRRDDRDLAITTLQQELDKVKNELVEARTTIFMTQQKEAPQEKQPATEEEKISITQESVKYLKSLKTGIQWLIDGYDVKLHLYHKDGKLVKVGWTGTRPR